MNIYLQTVFNIRLLPRHFGGKAPCECGFSLVELIVALAIGMLGTIVIFTVYQSAEGYKRTTVAAGDAQTNGAVALFSLEQYIRTSGSAITTTNEAQLSGAVNPPRPNLLLGCPLFGLPNASVVTGPAGAPTTPVAPVRIVDGSQTAGGIPSTPDVLVIMAGNSDISTNPTGAGPLAAGTTSLTTVSNLMGWRVASGTRLADIAMFVQRAGGGGGGAPQTVSAVPCSLRRLAALSTTSGAGAITLAAPTPTVNYVPTTNIHNVGPSPYFLSISVNAQNQLVETNFTPLLTGEGGVINRVLAEGIMNIQAQYGIDTNQDDVIDQWVEPIGAWANVTAADLPGTLSPGTASITKIKAIRIAILARSVQYEPPDRTLSPPACNSSPAIPAWRFLLRGIPSQGAGATASIALPQGVDVLPSVSAPTASPNGDWRCFRYRTFESIIPVINMVRSPL